MDESATNRWQCESLLWSILFFAPAAFGAVEWWARAALEFLIFLLAALCAFRRDFVSPPNAALLGLGSVLGLGFLQALHAHSLVDTAVFLPFTAARAQTLYALLWWGALIALLWSTCGILRWKGAARRLSWVIFSSGVAVAVIGFLQRWQGNVSYYVGLRPIYVGGPEQVDTVDAITSLWFALVFGQKRPRHLAFKLLSD